MRWAGPPARGDGRRRCPSLNDSDRSRREAYYCRLDYVLAAVAKGPVGVVRTGTEVIAPDRHTEFYTDWIRPHEFTDALPARLSGARKPPCLVVTAPRRTESFDTPERVKLMGALLPHLQQTLLTQTKLASPAQSSANLAAALEVVKHAAIIVSSGCRVINLNAASERILRTEDGLYFRSGCIGATSMTGERQLYRAVQDALTDGSNTRGGQSFTCGRRSGKRPYIIHVLPLYAADRHQTSSEATALVLIVDPENKPHPAAELLRRLYGLTLAEAEVALRILRSAKLKEIAEELSVSLSTVRTHLQHAFDKTDTHRQAELVRVMLPLGEWG